MLKKILIIAVEILLLLSPRFAEAYSVSTHAYLTNETLSLSARSSGNLLSEEDKLYIVDGAIHEDDMPRYLNHFYDPVYKRGLTEDGAIDPLYHLGSYGTSKDWAVNGSRQAGVVYAGFKVLASLFAPISEGSNATDTDFTWQAGIRAYTRGDRVKAMAVLGHMLHLIQDLTVPEHARNESHAFGSIYEDWASQYDLSHPDKNLHDSLKSKQIVLKNNLGDYFDEVAMYTNNNFYSPKTIGIQSGYSLPQPNTYELIQNRLYAIGNEGNYLLLKSAHSDLAIDSKNGVTLKDDKVLNDYWNHLAPKAVEYGAGVIDLFLKEGEKAKQDPSFVKDDPQSFLGEISDALGNFFGYQPKNTAIPKPSINLFAEIPQSSPQSLPVPARTIKPNVASSSAIIASTSSSPKTFENIIIIATSSSQATTTTPPLFFVGGAPPGAPQAAPASFSESDTSASSTVTSTPTSTPPLISSFSASITSSTIHFNWEMSTSSLTTSTLRDMAATSTDPMYIGNSAFYDASATLDGEIHTYDLSVLLDDGIESTTTSIRMPTPPPPPPSPLKPGINNLTWSVESESASAIFSAIVVSPIEGKKILMDMSFQPIATDLGSGGNFGNGPVNSGDTITITIPIGESGTYHWHARMAYEDPAVGWRSMDWTPIEEAEITLTPSEPKVSGGFPEGFVHGYCTGNKSAFSPTVDFVPSSAEFYAACVNGGCYPPNTFQIYDASGALLLETDGGSSSFGYPEPSHIWQKFPLGGPTLQAGITYYATPKSYNGQCMIAGSFYLR